MTQRRYFTDARTLSFEGRLVAAETYESKPAVRLEETYFFPTSGGQLHDTGTLDGVRVIDVVEQGESILHVLEQPIAKPPGSTVQGRIDGPRRWDHLRQHSGQHVLSQACLRVLGAETLSVHFGEIECTLDLARASLSNEDRDRVVDLANAVVMEDRPIRVHLLPPDEAMRRFPLRRAPIAEPVIRVVEIEAFDSSACCGTHAERTGEIGPIVVLGSERRKSGQTRVRFVCGDRAVRASHRHVDLVNQMVAHFMAPEDDVVNAAKRQTDRVRSLEKEREALREERLVVLARSLFDAAPVAAGHRIVAASPPDVEPSELGTLARAVALSGPSVVCVGCTGTSGNLVVVTTEESGVDARALLAVGLEVLGGRGGGKPTLAQGAGPRLERLEEALTVVAARSRVLLENR